MRDFRGFVIDLLPITFRSVSAVGLERPRGWRGQNPRGRGQTPRGRGHNPRGRGQVFWPRGRGQASRPNIPDHVTLWKFVSNNIPSNLLKVLNSDTDDFYRHSGHLCWNLIWITLTIIMDELYEWMLCCSITFIMKVEQVVSTSWEYWINETGETHIGGVFVFWICSSFKMINSRSFGYSSNLFVNPGEKK